MDKLLTYYSLGIGKVYRFIVLHLLWLGFTLFGGILFGIFPATHALLKTMKEPTDLGMGEYSNIFFRTYKSSFIKINQAAIIWLVMFTLMGMNLLIFKDSNLIVYLIVMGMLLLMVLCVLYFLQYFTAEGTIINQIKRSLGYVFLHPRQNIMYMCVLFGLILAVNFSPGITMFCGSSVAAHFIVKSWAI